MPRPSPRYTHTVASGGASVWPTKMRSSAATEWPRKSTYVASSVGTKRTMAAQSAITEVMKEERHMSSVRKESACCGSRRYEMKSTSVANAPPKRRWRPTRTTC